MTAEDKQALKRIIARLLGLADLAERASRRALPVQLLVLWILRIAEAHARNLVVGAARDFGYQVLLPSSFVDDIAPMILGSDGARSTDTLRLAMSFEMLAELLSDLVELASRDGRSFRLERLSQFLSHMKRASIQITRVHPLLKGEFRAACGAGWGDWRQSPHTNPFTHARAPPHAGSLPLAPT